MNLKKWLISEKGRTKKTKGDREGIFLITPAVKRE